MKADFDARLLADEIANCPIVTMELLWTARDAEELRKLRNELLALPQVEITSQVWERAFDVWAQLAARGPHRQVSRVDLVVAAAAELAGVPVCHYDADFEAIAEVTGQAQRAIAIVGTI